MRPKLLVKIARDFSSFEASLLSDPILIGMLSEAGTLEFFSFYKQLFCKQLGSFSRNFIL